MKIPRDKASLQAAGYDGLYHPTEPCGCWAEDLFPCGERPPECRAGMEKHGPNGDGIYPGRPRKAEAI